MPQERSGFSTCDSDKSRLKIKHKVNHERTTIRAHIHSSQGVLADTTHEVGSKVQLEGNLKKVTIPVCICPGGSQKGPHVL